MTSKKEQARIDAEFAALRLDLAKERAMRRSPKVERDVPHPEDFSLSTGWDYNAASYWGHGNVYKACSSSCSHGDGWEKTTSQRPVNLFSSELLATQAMRHEIAEKLASQMVELDAKIEVLKGGTR